MRATNFEFRHRYFLIMAIYAVGFSCYWIDHRNAARALLSLIGQDNNMFAIRWLIAIGALLIALGALLRTWAAAYLKSDVVHDTALHSDKLVADGPYRHLRNPLYAGVFLMNAGLGLLASLLGFGVIFFASLVFYGRLLLREEAQLLAAQGESYARFLEGVPCLWPSLTPRLPASGRTPEWGQAFLGEVTIWALAVATLMYAVTLRVGITYAIIALALIWGVIAQVRLRRKRARESGAGPV
jgi:protein-S-isoprenylcysteine O-methyltransferase Ste14